jgi:drug/metabolite transporter (DMT)-like permease
MPRWLLYSLVTMLLWGGWGLASKPLATTLGLLPVLVVLGASKQLRSGSNRRRGFWQAFAAGVISSLANVAYYQAMAAGGKVAAVLPLTALYPMVTIILAMLLLGERLNVVQWGGVGASLAALWFFNVSADSAWISPWLAMALIPIGLWGVSGLLQKLATSYASSELVTFAFLLGFLPAAVLIPALRPFTWQLSGTTWLWLFLLGLFFGLGNLTLIIAYGSGGRASIVTPMTSLYSLVTIPLAVALLHERIGGREGMGILLAVLAVIALGRETPAPAVTATSQ